MLPWLYPSWSVLNPGFFAEIVICILATMDSHRVQQVVSWVIHLELGKLIDSNRRGVSFISPSASCEKLKKVCAPLLKSLRNGLRCDFGLASAYVIRWCSVEYHRGGGHNSAQWIVITKANPEPGLDTLRTWFIPGSDTRSHRFRRLLVWRVEQYLAINATSIAWAKPGDLG